MSHIVVYTGHNNLHSGPTYFGDKTTTEAAVVAALDAVEVRQDTSRSVFKAERTVAWVLDRLHTLGFSVLGFTNSSVTNNLYWTLRRP